MEERLKNVIKKYLKSKFKNLGPIHRAVKKNEYFQIKNNELLINESFTGEISEMFDTGYTEANEIIEEWVKEITTRH